MYQPRGLYLDEFEIGKKYESQARTITETDVMNFAGLTGDFNPLHTDEEFAKKNMFGKRIGHGMLGAAISTGMSNQMGIFEGTTIAFLELSMKYTAPLIIGDTVHLVLEPTKATPSASGKKRGVVEFSAKLVNQEDKEIIDATWYIMMKMK